MCLKTYFKKEIKKSEMPNAITMAGKGAWHFALVLFMQVHNYYEALYADWHDGLNIWYAVFFLFAVVYSLTDFRAEH